MWKPDFHVTATTGSGGAGDQLALDYRMSSLRRRGTSSASQLGHTSRTRLRHAARMYKRIGAHAGTRKLYADKLLAQSVIAEGTPTS